MDIARVSRCGGHALGSRPVLVAADGRLVAAPVNTAIAAHSTRLCRLMLVAAGNDIQVYSLPTARPLGSLVGHSGQVTGMLTTKDPKVVFSCSMDGTSAYQLASQQRPEISRATFAVVEWDLISGTSVRSIVVGTPVTQIQPCGSDAVVLACTSSTVAAADSCGRELDAIVAVPTPPLPTFKLVLLSLVDSDAEPTELHSGLGVCPSSAHDSTGTVCAFAFRKQVLIVTQHTRTLHAITHTKPVTAVTLNDVSGSLVASDVEGQVYTWPGVMLPVAPGSLRQLASLDSLLPTSTHWHSSAVHCLQSTADGGYILSGGAEGVLVVQQVATGSRSFVPRLGSAVRQVATATTAPGADGTEDAAAAAQQLYYIVTLGDNTVAVLEASTHTVTGTVRAIATGRALQPLGAASGIRGGAAAPPALTGAAAVLGGFTDSEPTKVQPAVLVAHPPSGGFLAPSAAGTGHMQLYAPRAGSDTLANFVASFRITSRNSVSASEHSQPASTIITHAAVASDGSGLMTAECPSRGGVKVGPHTLRFFSYAGAADGTSSRYALETFVSMPITDTGLAHVAWRPGHDAPLVVTAAPRRTFRIWDRVKTSGFRGAHLGDAGKSVGQQKRPRGDAAGPQFVWRCRSVGFYRDHPLGALAFSGDGSLLAVGCGATVALWCPVKNTIKGVLPGISAGREAADRHQIKSLSWLGASPLLLAASESHVTLWNVLSCTPVWTYAAHAVATAPVLLPAKATGLGSSSPRPAALVVVATPAAELRAVAKAAAAAAEPVASTLQLASATQAADAAAAPAAKKASAKGANKAKKAPDAGSRRASKAAVESPVSARSTQHLVLWGAASVDPEAVLMLPQGMPVVKAITPLAGAGGVLSHAMLTCVDGSVWEAHLEVGDEHTGVLPSALPYSSTAVAARVLPAAAAAAAAADAAIEAPVVRMQKLSGKTDSDLGPLHTLPGVSDLSSYLLKPLLHSTAERLSKAARFGSGTPPVAGEEEEEDSMRMSLGRVVFEPMVQIDLGARLLELASSQMSDGVSWREVGSLAIFADSEKA